ncbi:MAG TPA: response regulator transcription factor [Mycobacterium sp.]|jgi:DNA-binding response OmpR family regulator|nr:response regulator transcription factor [Mycobacterium sp.]
MTCLEPGLAASATFEREHTHTALVIDDEERIRSVVIRALHLEGVDADGAADGDAALARLAARPYDLVILDLLMPGRDGFDTLHDIMRMNPDQAVLVLSCLSDVPTKIRGLTLGADDYLAKPFHIEELRARVHARLRSLRRHRRARISHGRLTLDLVSHRVTVGARCVQLAEREFQLLCELVSHSGQVVTKRHLLSQVWGYEPDDPSNVVDVYVRRLRARLGEDVIETVRGEGYRVG